MFESHGGFILLSCFQFPFHMTVKCALHETCLGACLKRVNVGGGGGAGLIYGCYLQNHDFAIFL